jgi:serine/threonine protein kinase
MYRAYNQDDGTEVVLKFLPSGFLDDEQFRAQFELEIRTLYLSDIKGIVHIDGLDSYQGEPYLLTRYMPGGSLQDELQKGIFSLEDALPIISRLAQALDAAHRRGVLHRNIKPSNILFDEDGQACLTDFGLVRRSQNLATTLINAVEGNPAYASPEQALGRADLDERSDIYSLAAVFFEMLTGQPPYPSDSPIQQAARHVAAPLPGLRRLRADIPLACEQALADALAKNPEQRYTTACEMVQAIADAANLPSGLPGSVTQQFFPVSSPSRGGVILRRLGCALIWLGLLGVFGVGVVFFQGIVNFQDVRDTAVAVLPFLPSYTPTATPVPPTITPTGYIAPTNTPMPTPTWTITPSPIWTSTPSLTPTITWTPLPTSLVIGSADKLAFVYQNNIWMMNLDGTGMTQLTTDGDAKHPKTDLQWTPDGKGLTYTMDKCYQLLAVNGEVAGSSTRLGCYDDFEISSDMNKMIIGGTVEMKNKTFVWRNFVGPYELSLLSSIRAVPQEEMMGGCPFEGGKNTRFSIDTNTMAAVFNKPLDGRLMDVIQVYQFRECGEPIDILDIFPGERFKMRGYSGPNDRAGIDDFGWDGYNLFALHGNYLNGYGNMIIYNMAERQGKQVDPIEGQCCYQDVQFSPDGQYLLFVYQDARKGFGAQVYYIPYSDVGVVQTFEPLKLPDLSFIKKERLEPALREYRP